MAPIASRVVSPTPQGSHSDGGGGWGGVADARGRFTRADLKGLLFTECARHTLYKSDRARRKEVAMPTPTPNPSHTLPRSKTFTYP